ncbi:heterokaryon incompatibility protein-domain-containing protein [Sordaria brevicollis]|uniref:Heterokaryon incompatibility protein-domain-containing protein n=1 Tax=Sordaria brevicollis TaxID=83679 RepID=A0AAE0PFZ9_SORBR|nr:heterokaryon incompatibility protein-domain-containing protein [Sordaria brevicollis]
MEPDTNFRHLRGLYKRLGKGNRSGGERSEVEHPESNSEGAEVFERSLARIRNRLKHHWREATSRRTDHVPRPGTDAVSMTRSGEDATDTLCENCLHFDFSKRTVLYDHQYGNEMNDDAVFTTFGKLLQSSATCSMCKLVLEGLETNISKANRGLLTHRVNENSRIFVSIMRYKKDVTATFILIPPEIKVVRLYSPKLTALSLLVYSDDKNFAHNPPLVPWSDKWLAVLKKWLHDCVHEHGSECRRRLSGEEIDESLPPLLPTRVIEVGSLKGSGNCRLLEPNGQRGHYTALSYCWGSAPKADRPYLTTAKTLERHLLGLPWDLLPKTIQDTILLTRAIGVRYLWIDSLCIIQDSEADWEKEAATMGQVYAQARLVIAATTGADAEAGLFPPQTYIHLPASGKRPSLYFSNSVRQNSSLQHDYPLLTRGWATQEWVLARRVVFWTGVRMSWLCAKFVRDANIESGLADYGGLFARYTKWDQIVTRYSERDLTHPEDKLIAIKGIANEIQKKKPNDKYAFGCWHSNLHWELLWSGQAAPSADSALKNLGIPSWSWASHPSSVQFLEVADEDSKQWRESDRSLVTLGDSAVRIMAECMPIDLHQPDIVSCRIHRRPNEHGSLRYKSSLDGGLSFTHSSLDYDSIKEVLCHTMRFSDAGYSVQITTLEGDILVVFDKENFLTTYQKSQNERNGRGRFASTPDDFWFVGLARSIMHSPVWHAGLVLRRNPDTSDKYTRVGLAFASERWMRDPEIGEFIVE